MTSMTKMLCISMAIIIGMASAEIFPGTCAADDVTCKVVGEVSDADADAASSGSVMLLQLGLEKASHSITDSMTDEVTEYTEELKSWQEALKEDPNVFVNCSKVFLDVGANRGTHVRKLFEPLKYPLAPYLAMFDKGFGPANVRTKPFAQTGICAFGFEANPRWSSTLRGLSDAYNAKGWRVKYFVPKAVSDTDGDNVTFWLNNAGNASDVGASEEKWSASSKAIQVPTLDLSNFMVELNKSASPGYRLMKMDIEGAEYETLLPFLTDNTLCKNVLDDLTIEWHSRFDKDNTTRDYHDGIQNVIESPAKCRAGASTNVIELDDESYMSDGKPLP